MAEPEPVFLITGASSGIGHATAKVLGAAGAKLVLGARREGRLATLVAELEAAGGTARAHKLDVRDLDEMRRFVEFAKAEFGRIDKQPSTHRTGWATRFRLRDWYLEDSSEASGAPTYWLNYLDRI